MGSYYRENQTPKEHTVRARTVKMGWFDSGCVFPTHDMRECVSSNSEKFVCRISKCIKLAYVCLHGLISDDDFWFIQFEMATKTIVTQNKKKSTQFEIG